MAGQAYEEMKTERLKKGKFVKIILLFIHFIVVLSFTIALLVLIGLAKTPAEVAE
jgi:hypothetical protein